MVPLPTDLAVAMRRFIADPELIATIQVRQLSGSFALRMLNPGGGESVRGLTGVQQSFGFSLDMPVVSF